VVHAAAVAVFMCVGRPHVPGARCPLVVTSHFRAPFVVVCPNPIRPPLACQPPLNLRELLRVPKTRLTQFSAPDLRLHVLVGSVSRLGLASQTEPCSVLHVATERQRQETLPAPRGGTSKPGSNKGVAVLFQNSTV
jgi:hypothetical protein